MKQITFIALFAIFGSIVNCQNGGLIQIAIQRNEAKAMKFIRLGASNELKLAVITTQQNLTDLFDSLYIGPITVGTPAVVTIPIYMTE